MAALEIALVFAAILMFGGVVAMAAVAGAAFPHPALRLQLRMHLLVTVHLGLLVTASWISTAPAFGSVLFADALFLPAGSPMAAALSLVAQAAFALELHAGVIGTFAITRDPAGRRFRRNLARLTTVVVAVLVAERLVNIATAFVPALAPLTALRRTIFLAGYIAVLGGGTYAVARFVTHVRRPAIPVSRTVLVVVGCACGFYVATILPLAAIRLLLDVDSPLAVVLEHVALIVYLAGLGVVGLGAGSDVFDRVLGRLKERDEPGRPPAQAPVVDRSLVDALSAREREVLELVVAGRLNKEIAATLGVSEHTIRNHVASIFRKLGVSHRTQLAGMVSPNPAAGGATRPPARADHPPEGP